MKISGWPNAKTMTHDIPRAILSHVSNFAVGLVKREMGKGSTVLGSGVFASVEGRRGILTCGHVAETYEKLGVTDSDVRLTRILGYKSGYEL
jgi:hypothetical protein